MKKTIASMALVVSATSANAFFIPDAEPQPVPKTYCLTSFTYPDGSVGVGTCDKSAENKLYNAPLNENKCAEGQVSFTSVEVEIESCPTFVQL